METPKVRIEKGGMWVTMPDGKATYVKDAEGFYRLLKRWALQNPGLLKPGVEVAS